MDPREGLLISHHTIKDYLAPSHHGRGIMTAALRTLINDWAIPHLNAHRIVVTAFFDNIGSQRVLLKNGFVCTGSMNAAQVAERMRSKGRNDSTLYIFEWRSLVSNDWYERSQAQYPCSQY